MNIKKIKEICAKIKGVVKRDKPIPLSLDELIDHRIKVGYQKGLCEDDIINRTFKFREEVCELPKNRGVICCYSIERSNEIKRIMEKDLNQRKRTNLLKLVRDYLFGEKY